MEREVAHPPARGCGYCPTIWVARANLEFADTSGYDPGVHDGEAARRMTGAGPTRRRRRIIRLIRHRRLDQGNATHAVALRRRHG